MREVLTEAELARIAAGDPIMAWAGQGQVGGRVRAWADGDALVVAAPRLFQRDRLCVQGPPDEVARLVPKARAQVGPEFRLFGADHLVRELAERLPGVTILNAFGWMDTAEQPVGRTTAAWIDDDAQVEAVLAEASPSSWARPGESGVTRWAGIRADSGELLSVAADAWSAPEIGFMAGVATRPSARGQGLSGDVCGFVTAELVKRHGRSALIVEGDNLAALAVYRRLGYTYRPVATAAFQ